MAEMLAENERELAEKIVALIHAIPEVQELAQKVKASGGNVQRAVLSLVDDDERADFMMQWPLIAMFLGV